VKRKDFIIGHEAAVEYKNMSRGFVCLLLIMRLLNLITNIDYSDTLYTIVPSAAVPFRKLKIHIYSIKFNTTTLGLSYIYTLAYMKGRYCVSYLDTTHILTHNHTENQYNFSAGKRSDTC
jgi:hypothetical protein